MMNKLKNNYKITIVILFIITLSILSIIYSAISLYRYSAWQVFYYDAGYFARIIYKFSQLQIPVIRHINLGEIFFYEDHFSPSLAMLAPFIWIWSDIRILLIEQALAIAGCVTMILAISKKEKLNWVSAFAVSLSYAIFTGALSPLISDWHVEPTAGLFLLFFYYFFKNKFQKKWLWLSTGLIFLGFKESNAVILFLLLSLLFLKQAKKRKVIAACMIFCIGYFLLITRIVIPEYYYLPTYPSNISELKQTLSYPQKWQTLWQSIFSFGGLPLISPVWLGLALAELSTRFLPINSFFSNFSLGMHYSFYFSLFLSLATVFALKKFNQKKKLQLAAGLWLILASLFSARKITISPINLAASPVMWQQLSGQKPDLKQLVDDIDHHPGSIMAQNNILPRFFDRQENIFLLEQDYEKFSPHWVIFDLSADQNPNNFYGPNGGVNQGFMEKVEQKIATDSAYVKVEKYEKPFYVYQKK